MAVRTFRWGTRSAHSGPKGRWSPEKTLEGALGTSNPRFIAVMKFEPSKRKLNIYVDFDVGGRLTVPGQTRGRLVPGTVPKTCWHLDFSQA